MDIDSIFPSTNLGWIIVVILITAYGILVIETLRKRGIRSQSFFTYFLWVILDILTFLTAVAEESSSLILIFGCILFSSFLSVLLMKYDKTKKWTSDETVTSVIIVIVVTVWLLSKSNLLGLVLAVIAEVIAGWPQMKRSWRNPGSRLTLVSYILFIIGYLISIIDSPDWQLENVIFPLAFFIYCIVDTLPLIWKWWKIEKRYESIKKCSLKKI